MKSNNSSILKTVNTLLTNTEIDWQNLLETVVSNFDCTTGTLHFLDKKTQLLQVQAHAGVPDFLLPKLATIPIGKGMAGIAAERKKPVEMCNLQRDSSGVARPAAKETKVEGSVAAPLILDKVLYGVIGIGKRVPYDFTAAETRELMAIGEAISGVLEK
ncbi:GAF domain-containing protein [Maribacter antarcticus]|uniref:GAF domain-containing protein n=1 Tax=Maribacter antarcticus TaxID=505250 RepID=UPI000688655A|nr:GAF domain-containing protein [Maribacter antarcticus]